MSVDLLRASVSGDDGAIDPTRAKAIDEILQVFNKTETASLVQEAVEYADRSARGKASQGAKVVHSPTKVIRSPEHGKMYVLLVFFNYRIEQSLSVIGYTNDLNKAKMIARNKVDEEKENGEEVIEFKTTIEGDREGLEIALAIENYSNSEVIYQVTAGNGYRRNIYVVVEAHFF